MNAIDLISQILFRILDTSKVIHPSNPFRYTINAFSPKRIVYTETGITMKEQALRAT